MQVSCPVYIHMYVYIYVYIYTVYIYIHMYTCICMYIYTYVRVAEGGRDLNWDKIILAEGGLAWGIIRAMHYTR